MRVSKNLRTHIRIPKTTGLTRSSGAVDIFLKQLMVFKRRRKYHRWIPVNPIVLKGKTRKIFEQVTNALESFRCSLGIEPLLFYKLICEFVVVPSGRKYYPLREIFSEDNPASEEFVVRIVDTMPWIADLVSYDFNNDHEVKMVRDFSKELETRKISAESTFKSKDWYCIVAIKRMASKKGWDEIELLNRIGKYYKRRMKKVTAEMVLADLAHHELDNISIIEKEVKEKKVRMKKQKIIGITQDWLRDFSWLKDLERRDGEIHK